MFRLLKDSDGDRLFRFLYDLEDDGMFDPHPRTIEVAWDVCSNRGRDRYYGIFVRDTGEMIAYGMLRGFDEGFENPSLGIAVRKQDRRHGFGRKMMSFLHIEAVSMGASKIRLRVRPENEAAKALYTSFGYEFSGEIDRKEEVWWHTF